MTQPIPIAVRLPSGITLRGHEWSVDGMPVLFVHDLGEDLDAWGSVPADLARSGFRVVNVELRGHGLSDGEPDPDAVVTDVQELVGEVAGSFGPVAVVMHGGASEAALYLDVNQSPVQVMVTPQPLNPKGIDWGRTAKSMRIVMVGAKSEVALEYAEGIYPKMHGQNMWASTGTEDQGPDLLASHPAMLEQVVMFVRRYLTGHHLAWIAAHGDEIKAASENPET